MKIVFDTNVLISATLWDESVAQKLLKILIRKDAKIFTSIEIIDEYKNVLKRDFEYSEDEIKSVIQKILYFSSIILPKEKISVVKDDPDDNKIIECAISANADFILTYDKHLLQLKKFKQAEIIKPEELLKILKEEMK